MHIYLAKSSRFESTDFASVMIDDVISVPSVNSWDAWCQPLQETHILSFSGVFGNIDRVRRTAPDDMTSSASVFNMPNWSCHWTRDEAKQWIAPLVVIN